MKYRYPASRIHEIVKAEKALVEGHSVEPVHRGTRGLGFEADLELLDGPFMDLIFRGKAGDSAQPVTFDSNLFLDQQRIRGVGYCPVERRNFRAKQRIPKGWHQNIVNPNKSTTDPAYNRHEPLEDFAPVDFEDFTRKVAAIWKIDLDWEKSLL